MISRRRAICTLFRVGRGDVLRNGVPQRTVTPRPRADETHECRWAGEGGRGKVVIGVVAGRGAILGTIWGEREDALVHTWKTEGERRTCVDSVVRQLSKGWDMQWIKRLVLFFRGNESLRLARISVESICMYLCLGMAYRPFYLHPNLKSACRPFALHVKRSWHK